MDVEQTLKVLEKVIGGYVTSAADRKAAFSHAIAIIKAAKAVADHSMLNTPISYSVNRSTMESLLSLLSPVEQKKEA